MQVLLAKNKNIYYDIFNSAKDVNNMPDMTNTQYFKVVDDNNLEVADIFKSVCQALNEKGYNPINQIVGFIMSGDPTYITSHNNARILIQKVERDELVEELLRNYIATKNL